MYDMDGVYQQHQATSTVDVLELCGGEGRCTTIALRRKLHAGGNLDIVTGTDLTDPFTQDEVLHYINKWQVLVVVMAPVCRPFGPWAHFNQVANYDGWLRSYNEAAPLAKFCGRVARNQIRHKRHFIYRAAQGVNALRRDALAGSAKHDRCCICGF